MARSLYRSAKGENLGARPVVENLEACVDPELILVMIQTRYLKP